MSRTLAVRLLPILLACVSGCASIPEAARQIPAAGIELEAVPFHAQTRYQCGPAALTTVLQASDADVLLDDVVDKVYIPERRGSLQLELLAATRTSGRVPYIIDTTLAAVLAELEAGRPVLVMQNLGIRAIPRWHYAVVVGIDSARNRVILRSGTDRRRETPTDVFLRTWSRSDFWGFVVLRPGELPANPDRGRYFEAVLALEQTGHADAAARAWQAAVGEWPLNTTARFGLGNARLAMGDHRAAEREYRELLAIDPAVAVARNNLSLALAGQSRLDEALSEIEQAIALNEDPDIEDLLEGTLAEIRQQRASRRTDTEPRINRPTDR